MEESRLLKRVRGEVRGVRSRTNRDIAGGERRRFVFRFRPVVFIVCQSVCVLQFWAITCADFGV